MTKKSNLPIEAHNHFQKANLLHGYAEKSFVEFADYAVEIGAELTAAKASVPHGGWEIECKRLFNGSLSTAKFYMQFSKNWAAISKRQRQAILFLESSLDGAAKAAKKAAKPDPQPTPPDPAPPEPELIAEPVPESLPEAVEPCGLIVEPPTNGNGNGKPPKQYEPEVWLRRWDQAIRGPVKFVDTLQEGLGQRNSQHSRAVLVHLSHATDAMMEWLDVD